MDPIRISRKLGRDVDRLVFGPPVTHVYNPLVHARATHERYLERYAGLGADTLFVGMNPGPWGMVQTGVPFGEVELVRDWLDIEGPVEKPRDEHPARPVTGFACERREVSGQRVWGWARDRFGEPEAFFRRFFVWNYCPLTFMEESGRNRTPDKLPAAEREPLYALCDDALRRVVAALEPERVIGMGRFAEGRARAALATSDGLDVAIGTILHPSPASPIANRGWAPQAEAQLEALGVEL